MTLVERIGAMRDVAREYHATKIRLSVANHAVLTELLSADGPEATVLSQMLEAADLPTDRVEFWQGARLVGRSIFDLPSSL